MAAKKQPPSPGEQTPPESPPPENPSEEAERPETDADDTAGFPVVGIGASAGGLDAFKKFFTAMPPDSGMAFVLLPHLDPKHESMMVDLVARRTAMPVVEASEGMRVEPNHVYIIPPNRYLAIRGGALQLSGPVEVRGPKTSIDLFLRSLSQDVRDKAVCVILSGTGAHGTLGLKAVKDQGGMAMVQDPATAEYESMPQSALATGLVDYVLPPERMPEALLGFVRHYYVDGASRAAPTEAVADQVYHVLSLLRVRARLDFHHYRKRMLTRRIERRMGLSRIDSMAAYLDFLRAHPEEVKQLSRDLLISVTSFFRDPEAYETLATQVVPRLLASKEQDAAVRVWVAGCATGEEAYSLAMVFLEQIQAADSSCRVQVFASDVNTDALEVAQQGVYPESIVADVPPERLKRFFTKLDGGSYRVSKQLREAVIFARQNLISDPPFSKLDLISCRNLLIYLEPDVQRKIIMLLHFALNDGGYLLLGPSETIGRGVDLFEPVSKRWRLYRRIGPTRPDRVEFPIVARTEQAGGSVAPAEAARPRQPSIADLANQALLAHFAPAAVLINRKYEILYYHGPTGLYLDLPAGEPTHDLLRMARDGLRTKLRAAVQRAVRDKQRVVLAPVRVKRDHAAFRAKVTVEPLQAPKAAQGLLLVVFEEAAAPAPAPESAESAESVERELEFQLRVAREDLQSTVEELESANEELKSSNEEVMSMNEELQSANEELETSKEELQSLNEELSTVNTQLQEKVGELEGINNDLSNLFGATDIATIFLDSGLRIKRFTPATGRVFSLIAADVGRPFRDIAQKLHDPDLLADAAEVRGQLVPREKTVRTEAGGWYTRRIIPYRTLEDRIEGVVLTFTDVTALKRVEEAIRRSEEAVRRQLAEIETIYAAAPVGLASFDRDLRYVRINRVLAEMNGLPAEAHLGRSLREVLPELAPALEPILRRVLETGAPLLDVDVSGTLRAAPGVERAWMGSYFPVKDEQGRVTALSVAVREVTERKRVEAEIRRLNAELERRVTERTAELEAEVAERRRAEEALSVSNRKLAAILSTAAEGIITVDRDGVVNSFNLAAEQIFGYTAQEMQGQVVTRLLATPFPADQEGGVLHYLRTGSAEAPSVGFQKFGRRKDGSTFSVELAVSRVDDGRELFTVLARDVSGRKQLERAVLEATSAEQRRIGQDLHDSVGQELTGLNLTADSLVRSFPDPDAPAARIARKMADALRRTLKQVRALSRGLTPVEVDAQGLMSALAELAAATNDLPEIACTFDCEEPVPVEDSVKATHLYHIAQEAVTNALRHGRAKQIRIGLAADARALTLSVRDDGVGPPPDPSNAARGMGLKIMRYRANLMNANLSVEPAEGGGTLVQCVLAKG